MADRNNVIAKVLSLIGDKMDGDSVMLVDQHLPNALKTTCKFIAENRPVGHEKLLLDQTLLSTVLSPSENPEEEYYDFQLTDLTYPIVETGKFHRISIHHRNHYYLSDSGTSSIDGKWEYAEDFGGFPAYLPDGSEDALVNTFAMRVAGGFWIIPNLQVGYYLADDDPMPAYPDLVAVWSKNGTVDLPAPTFTLGKARGKNVKSVFALLLAENHGEFYYMIEGNNVFLNMEGISRIKDITITHYIYATIAQFPAELEDLLVAELARIISNESAKQRNEKIDELQSR